MYQYLITSVKDGIGTIILNDPQKRNALSQAMAAELHEALLAYRFDPEVRVVVLRGAEGCFCAGGDITSMKKRVDCYANGLQTGDSDQGEHGTFQSAYTRHPADRKTGGELDRRRLRRRRPKPRHGL
ncbi:enoyl-CoA hydratase/isomerase family protein [Clostridium sp. AN503]|uniref:enoyl-CoA hydratase/isomerase family protein n=1 Tax=Clostridium sp. AN503 TaxID=3160598 RepID=UPI003457C6FE